MNGPLWPLVAVVGSAVVIIPVLLAASAVMDAIRRWAEPYTSERIYNVGDRPVKKP